MRRLFFIISMFLPLAVRADDLHSELVSSLETLAARREESPQKVESYKPVALGNLATLETDAVKLLAGLPYVEEVRRDLHPKQPQRRVVVFANFHVVERNLFVADLEHHRGRKLTERERVLEYWRFLATVETVQLEQLAALQCLIRRHGLREAFDEGLVVGGSANSDIAQLVNNVRAVSKYEREFLSATAGQLRTLQTRQNIDTGTCESMLRVQQSRYALLEGGSLFRLYEQDLLRRVLPCEDQKAYAAGAPRFEQDQPVFDADAFEQREDAIVANLLKAGPVSVLMIGAAHDLSDNLKRLDPHAELIVVRVQGVPAMGK